MFAEILNQNPETSLGTLVKLLCSFAQHPQIPDQKISQKPSEKLSDTFFQAPVCHVCSRPLFSFFFYWIFQVTEKRGTQHQVYIWSGDGTLGLHDPTKNHMGIQKCAAWAISGMYVWESSVCHVNPSPPLGFTSESERSLLNSTARAQRWRSEFLLG